MNTVYKRDFNDNCELKEILVDGASLNCIPPRAHKQGIMSSVGTKAPQLYGPNTGSLAPGVR